MDERVERLGDAIESAPVPYQSELDFFDKYNLRGR